ncbi:hypothetical protein [Desulfospira joergensenii]|uniref:hypothetical protein n=1 Tax=Desulfospira joergensenii TaxID=53329 RepID=UPI0003B47375|nr:hypothetical protein [Desulfospira joergensenii]
MLFLKQIFDHRMASKEFQQLYQRECHICSTTMKLVSVMEKDRDALPGILNSLDISFQNYENIRQGEDCNPRVVERLCRHLGIGEPGLFKNCPRWPK